MVVYGLGRSFSLIVLAGGLKYDIYLKAFQTKPFPLFLKKPKELGIMWY